ncbi:MAG: trimethylamine methyltransferase family protein [Nocardioidaceae bacterium]|nr:trimethylamine methyltransferase family protein [Nocardioidaceae bacterium]
MTVEDTGRRAGGRRRHRDRATVPAGPQQPPWRTLRRPYEPVRAVSDDQLEAIHQASLRVLAETGMDFLHPRARTMWADAGADVQGDRVRMDPALVDSLVAHAPTTFRLHARNPARDVEIGGDAVVFSSVASAPYVGDNAGGRREGNAKDFQALVRLSQTLNAIHVHGGYPVEPTDIHASVRHLHATRTLLTASDKAVSAYSLGAQRNIDCLEMVRIARQVDDETLERETSIHTVINASSPLRLDHPMLEGVLEYSARNQMVIVTPFTLAGAMAPVTLAGALAQQNAEALAGIAFTQLVRPGAPVVYGGFTSNVDMRSGSPAFGTPEFMKAALVGGQLARRAGVPYRSSNVCAANAVDSQSAYESVFSLWGAVMGGANLVYHGAGWLEGGLRSSFEKMVIDADLLQMVAAFLQPLVVDDASLAVETIAEVGPGGHFFGTQHTQDRFRDAFFAPMVSDWRNFESWEEAGSPTALDHAARLAGELADGYEQPSMDPEVLAELDDFVARRVAEGGVPTDF